MEGNKQIKTYADSEKWKELKELLSEYDDSRKTSNAHYSRLAFSIALKHLKDHRKKEKQKAYDYKELKKEIKEVINNG